MRSRQLHKILAALSLKGEEVSMTETERPASLTAFGFPSQDAAAVIVEQTPAQRAMRVLMGDASFWGLALCGLFIPVAHFMLVPSFVVAGIVVAVRRAREDLRLIVVRGA